MNTDFIEDTNQVLENTISGISDWNTSSVSDMTNVFAGNSLFNETLNWNTTNVTDMTNMFNGASSFSQSSISSWDYSNVTVLDDFIKDTGYIPSELNSIINSLFLNPSLTSNSAVKQIVITAITSTIAKTFIFDISTSIWNSYEPKVYPVVNTGNSFSINLNLFDISVNNDITTISWKWLKYDISSNTDGLSFNTNVVPYGNHPSINIKKFDGIPLCNMDSSSNASFYGFTGKIIAEDLPTIPNTSLSYCFMNSKCDSYGNIGSWDVSNILTMNNMFYDSSINNPTIGNWNFSKTNSMENFITNSDFDLNNIYSLFSTISTNTNTNTNTSINFGEIPAYRPTQVSPLITSLNNKNIFFNTNTIYNDIISATYTYLINTLQYTSSILRKKGYYASELKTLGYSVSELVDAGYISSDFKNANYTVYDLFYMYTTVNNTLITIPVIEIK